MNPRFEFRDSGSACRASRKATRCILFSLPTRKTARARRRGAEAERSFTTFGRRKRSRKRARAVEERSREKEGEMTGGNFAGAGGRKGRDPTGLF